MRCMNHPPRRVGDLGQCGRLGTVEVLSSHDRARHDDLADLAVGQQQVVGPGGIGSSRIRMIRASTPSTGRPTHTPIPRSVRVAGLPQDLVAADRCDRQCFGRAVGCMDLSGRVEQASQSFQDRRRNGRAPAEMTRFRVGNRREELSACREPAEQSRRAEQVRHAEIVDRLENPGGVDPGRSSRVHVRHDRRHPQCRREECKQRERAEIDLTRLDRVQRAERLDLA